MIRKIVQILKKITLDHETRHYHYCVSIKSSIASQLYTHLNRDDGQEDICFALYKISSGKNRKNFLIHEIILPENGDRLVHGNVEIKDKYFQRALSLAQKSQSGLSILHSHPCGYNWQDMSKDDVTLEKGMLSNRTFGTTKKYLLGLTLAGENDFWSARVWIKTDKGYYRENCLSVKTMIDGKIVLNFYKKHHQYFNYIKSSSQKRTVDSWGERNQEVLINTKIGIVGLGSVGSMVAESLARSGAKKFVLIDNEKIERKNLDRHISATSSDIGKFKVDVVKERVEKICTSQEIELTSREIQVGEKDCFSLLCDCDVIFCCVDNNNARHILNTISHTQFIPVIEGGLMIDPLLHNEEVQNIDTVIMKMSSTFPCLKCLACLNRYKISQAQQRKNDAYIATLEARDAGENVFCFSGLLASLQVSYFFSLLFGALHLRNFSAVLMRIDDSNIKMEGREKNNDSCGPNCFTKKLPVGDEAKDVIPSELN